MTMSNVTTERLKKIASWRETYGDEASVMISALEAKQIVAELLAVREATPYGYLRENNGQVQISIGPIRPADRASGYATPWGAIYAAPSAAPPALPANVIGRYATPDDSPYPATIAGGAELAQAWADGYNVSNAATCAPAVPGEHPLRNSMSSHHRSYADGWNACRAAMLQQQNEPQNIPNNIPTGCKWTFDEHDYKWDSACGESWLFTDGGPEENGVKFCQGCGKPLSLAAAPTPTHE